MKAFRRTIALMLCLIMALGMIVPAAAEDEPAVLYSGTCGTSLGWSITDDGYLNIGGSGAMTNYSNVSQVPWMAYKSSFNKLRILEGTGTIGKNAFYACTNLTGTLTLPNGLTSIGEKAFQNCSGLTGSLVIPDTVTSLGNYAFSGCSGFTSLTIGNSVGSISEMCFYNCTGFTGDLYLPESVSYIRKSAFYGCVNFDGKLTIARTPVYTYADCFHGCGANKDIVRFFENHPNYIRYTVVSETPATYYSTGSRVLDVYCKDSTHTSDSAAKICRYTQITPKLTANIETISFLGIDGSLALAEGQTYSLTPVITPSYATDPTLSYSSSDPSIATVDAAGTITAVSEGIALITAVANDGGGASQCIAVSVGNGVTCVSYGNLGTIYGAAANVYYTIDSNGVFSISGTGKIPGAVNTKYPNHDTPYPTLCLYPYGSDSYLLYNDYKDLVHSLVIADGITGINYMAFNNFTELTGDLILPDSVTSLDYYVFEGCSGFDGRLVLSNNLSSIPDSAFKGCSGFTGNLAIPASVTSIGGHAFEGCSGFTGNLTIPDSVATLGDYAFSGCSGFDGSLTIPGNWTTIGNFVFNSCSGLTGNLVLPNGLNSIGDGAFYRCSSLTGTLTLSGTLTSIGSSAFNTCSGFTGNLTIPTSVTTIGSGAFGYCTGFTGSLVIPNSVTSLGGGAFMRCSGFDGTLTLSNMLTKVEGYTFADCTGFTGALIIPTRVTEIGQAAFMNCSGFNGTLTLSGNLQKIGDYAFDTCSGFTGNLTIPNNVTYIGELAFNDCTGFDGTLTIGNNVHVIKYAAFDSCVNFTGKLSLPSRLSSTQYSESKFTYTSTEYAIEWDAFHACGLNSDIEYFFEDYPQFLSIRTNGNNTFTGIYCSGCDMLLKYISLDFDDGMELDVGETRDTNAVVIPSDATNPTLIYTSSNPSIATVDSTGKVTGVTPGTVNVTVTIDGNDHLFATIPVTVRGVAYDITVPENMTLTVGEEKASGAAFVPEISGTLTFTSADPTIATVDATGKVTGVAIGSTTVTVTDGTVSKTFTVNVVATPVTGIDLGDLESGVIIPVGGTKDTDITVTPADATDPSLTYTSSDPSIATVDADGTITGVAPGTVTITVTTNDGSEITKTFTVTVYDITVPESMILVVGEKLPLSIEITPDVSVGITTLSTNTKIATIVDRIVTGIAPGKAVIIVSVGTVEKLCVVTVVDLNVSESNDKINTSLTVPETDDVKIVSVTYTSDNTAAVTVDADGNITRVGKGSATVKVTATILVNGRLKTVTRTITVQGDNSFKCKRCDWYEANKDKKGIYGFVVWMVHWITHLVQHINYLT